jgi:lipoyl(octanoyl) transferase
MAVDEVLLADAIDSGVATLRLYEWSEPTLSLGYFQRYDDRQRHAASNLATVVRRQSGGGAILHDRELTYSLVLPASHRLSRFAEGLYTTVHEAIVRVLQPHATAGGDGWSLLLRANGTDLTAHEEPFLCFERQAKGDVILASPQRIPIRTTPPPGRKILGSAQRRRQGAILQHGSLLLRTSPLAPEVAGFNDLRGADLRAPDLAAAIAQCISDAINLRPKNTSLPENLRRRAAELESRKYAASTWTKRR